MTAIMLLPLETSIPTQDVYKRQVQATATDLKRLVLRGSNSTYDSLPTLYRFENFAFTKLRSVYRQRTGLELDAQDFVSFGLVLSLIHI